MNSTLGFISRKSTGKARVTEERMLIRTEKNNEKINQMNIERNIKNKYNKGELDCYASHVKHSKQEKQKKLLTEREDFEKIIVKLIVAKVFEHNYSKD